MKRIALSTLLLLMINAAVAQIYVRANVGYNLPMNSGLLDIDQDFNGSNGQYTISGVYGSYGSGVSANVAVGGGFGNGILGYDVEVGYLMGKKYGSANRSVSGNGTSYNEYTTSRQSKSIQFAPSVTFTAGSGNFHPFARMGPVIGITSIKDRYEYEGTNLPLYVQEYRYYGGLSLGFKGVVGVAYNLNELIDLFAEIDFISMSYAAKKRKLQEYTRDGEDISDQLDPKRLEEEELEKEFEVGGEEYNPPVREPLPMGSIGLQLGVKFKF